MAMVMPRARSSGALSIESNERNSASPLSASTFVIAAVSVVFPWSTWPIVPTFTWGFVRSNFFFAIPSSPVRQRSGGGGPCPPPPDMTATLRPRLGEQFGAYVARDRLVVRELHRVGCAALGGRAEVGRVAEHLRQRHLGLHDLRVAAHLHALD